MASRPVRVTFTYDLAAFRDAMERAKAAVAAFAANRPNGSTDA